MSPLSLSILLQLAGIAVVIAEIILPSGGLLTLMAVGLFGYSLFVVFHDISTAVGAVFISADIIIIPLLVITGLKLLAKSPVTLRTKLSRNEGVVSQSPELDEYIDTSGKAVTDLHPAGKAVINGKRIDVVSRGEYIDRDSDIVVIAVTGNQIIVREKDE
jgi:membrane-bound serine protease (ClpP class)